MAFGKRFLKKVKRLFRKRTSHKQNASEDDVSENAPTTPRRHSNDTHSNWALSAPGRDTRSMSKRGSGLIRHAAGISNSVNRQNVEIESAGHPAPYGLDGEFITNNTDSTANVSAEMSQQRTRQQGTKRRYHTNKQNMQSVETSQEVIISKSTTSDSPSLRPTASNTNENEGAHLLKSGQPSASMFSGLHNASISGGTFVQNIVNSDRTGFVLLQKRVATSAFHNSAQRVDPPRCHPNTRVAIQRQIYDWILSDFDKRKAWIMWLHGAAGAGKSATMQSIAELCVRDEIALASFFYIRTDPNRNTMAPVFATLAYQLVLSIPETQHEILTVIERNPLIFDQSHEIQRQQLLIQPLLHLPKHFQRLFVVFIDGLDKCNNRNYQSNLIKLLANVTRSRKIQALFVIASRREPQIEAAFVQKNVDDLLLTLPLDNSDVEQTSDDIRLFLTDKFKELRETHLRKHLLSASWPPMPVVEEIVTKSSGQFIYASVVINYVSSPRANPAHQLDVVRGIRLRDPSSQNPFAHLDALYQHIFSQVAEGLDKVFNILAFVLITGHNSISSMELLFLLESGELEIYLADLTAIIQCSGDQLKFLHASLPDFLRDKSRSENYHIDVDEYRTKLLCIFLARVPPIHNPSLPTFDVNAQEFWWLTAIRVLLEREKVSERLQRSFMDFHFSFYSSETAYTNGLISIDILAFLRRLDFKDRGRVYRYVLELFAVAFAAHWPLTDDPKKDGAMLEDPDLLKRINQIYRQRRR